MYVLSRVLFIPGVEPHWARSSPEYLRSFGERYLDPLFFPPGALFVFFCNGVATFGEKKEISNYMSTFHPKMGPFCLNKSRPKLSVRTHWSVSTIVQNDIPKKWPAALDASPEMGGGTSRKADPIRPFPASNTPAKVSKPPFSVFKTGLPKRDGVSVDYQAFFHIWGTSASEYLVCSDELVWTINHFVIRNFRRKFLG